MIGTRVKRDLGLETMTGGLRCDSAKRSVSRPLTARAEHTRRVMEQSKRALDDLDDLMDDDRSLSASVVHPNIREMRRLSSIFQDLTLRAIREHFGRTPLNGLHENPSFEKIYASSNSLPNNVNRSLEKSKCCWLSSGEKLSM